MAARLMCNFHGHRSRTYVMRACRSAGGGGTSNTPICTPVPSQTRTVSSSPHETMANGSGMTQVCRTDAACALNVHATFTSAGSTAYCGSAGIANNGTHQIGTARNRFTKQTTKANGRPTGCAYGWLDHRRLNRSRRCPVCARMIQLATR
jgi:hypothetical protein